MLIQDDVICGTDNVFPVVKLAEAVSYEHGNKISSTKLKVHVLTEKNQVHIVIYFIGRSSEKVAQLKAHSPYNHEISSL